MGSVSLAPARKWPFINQLSTSPSLDWNKNVRNTKLIISKEEGILPMYIRVTGDIAKA